MARQRHHCMADFKTKVALAAIKGQQPVNEFATIYGVHPNQVMQWNKQALEALPDVFPSLLARTAQDDETLQARLYQQIGMRRQCQLLGVNRVGLYYQPEDERGGNPHLMRLLDEPYTRGAFYGLLRMTAWLRQKRYPVYEKQVLGASGIPT